MSLKYMNPIKNIVFWILGIFIVVVNIPQAWKDYSGDIPTIAFEGAIMMVGWAAIWVVGAVVINIFTVVKEEIKYPSSYNPGDQPTNHHYSSFKSYYFDIPIFLPSFRNAYSHYKKTY